MNLRREANENLIYRQVLSIIGLLGGLTYITYCLIAKKVDPMMEGIAFIAILFGGVSIMKQINLLLPTIHSFKKRRKVEKELQELLGPIPDSAPTHESHPPTND